ncbi:PGM, partial [Symbiodinium pilosum]
RKWVYFIRHGEALVNAAGRVFAKDDPRKKAVRQDMKYFDSHLSEKGLEQARALRQSIPQVDVVIASPLTRALQTATAVFGCDEPGGPRLYALEATSALREFCGKQYQPCDSRRSIQELQAEFPHADFSEVPPGPDELLGPGK